MFGDSDPIPLSDLHRFVVIHGTQTIENHQGVLDPSNNFQLQGSHHSESAGVILFRQTCYVGIH